jgi:hypothetical protein
MAQQLNEIEANASLERSVGSPMAMNGVSDFDLGMIEMESDAETETEEG